MFVLKYVSFKSTGLTHCRSTSSQKKFKARDEIHLAKSGKELFGRRVASLIRRALNWNKRGKVAKAQNQICSQESRVQREKQEARIRIQIIGRY